MLFICRPGPSISRVDMDGFLPLAERCSERLKIGRRDQEEIFHFFPNWPHNGSWLPGCEPFHHEPVVTELDALIRTAITPVDHNVFEKKQIHICGLLTQELYQQISGKLNRLKMPFRISSGAFSLLNLEIPQKAS